MCGGFRRLLFFSLPPRGEGAPVLTLGRMRGQVSDWGRCTQRGFRSYLRAKSRPSGGGFLSQRWERNQWPRPPSLGTAGQFTLRIAGGRGRRALRVHRTAYPRTLLRGTPYCLILLDFRRTKSEWLSASPFGPLGPGLVENCNGCDFTTAPGFVEPTVLGLLTAGGPRASPTQSRKIFLKPVGEGLKVNRPKAERSHPGVCPLPPFSRNGPLSAVGAAISRPLPLPPGRWGPESAKTAAGVVPHLHLGRPSRWRLMLGCRARPPGRAACICGPAGVRPLR